MTFPHPRFVTSRTFDAPRERVRQPLTTPEFSSHAPDDKD